MAKNIKNLEIELEYENHIMCFRIIDWMFVYWYITLTINFLINRFLLMPQGVTEFMDYVQLIIGPPLLIIGEAFFLGVGGLAEIPAEMIADCLFPRYPAESPVEQEKQS